MVGLDLNAVTRFPSHFTIKGSVSTRLISRRITAFGGAAVSMFSFTKSLVSLRRAFFCFRFIVFSESHCLVSANLAPQTYIEPFLFKSPDFTSFEGSGQGWPAIHLPVRVPKRVK